MTGANALEVAAKFRPHLVLMDIGLPGMDGYEVARRMRADPNFEGVTLCALTGYTPSEGDRLRQQAGFNHHFVKPVSVIALTELLNSVRKVAM
jgi:CheY-like chemotaxis protein